MLLKESFKTIIDHFQEEISTLTSVISLIPKDKQVCSNDQWYSAYCRKFHLKTFINQLQRELENVA